MNTQIPAAMAPANNRATPGSRTTRTPTAAVWTRALAIYGLFVAIVIASTWPTLPVMADIWLSSSAFHHGLVVAPISAWLIYTTREELLATQSPKTFLFAIIAIIIAALAWLSGRAGGVQLIEQLAFITLLIAGFAGIFGKSVAVKNAFALAFLYFMAPFGAVLLPFLQQWTAEFTIAALNIIGMSADLNGVMITTSAGRFEVAEACAGLRFLIASIMVAALISHLAFRDLRKQALFIGAAVLVAIVANWVRAFLLVYLATLTEKKIGVGPEHLLIGWLFYGALFVALAAAGRHFAEPQRSSNRPIPTAREQSRSKVFIFLAPALGIVFAASIYAHIVVNRSPVGQESATLPVSLSLLNAPNWRIATPAITWRPSIEHADRVAHAVYIKEKKQIQLTASYFTHDRPGAEIAGYDSSIRPDGDWRKTGFAQADFAINGVIFSLPLTIFEGSRGERAIAVQIYWLDDMLYAAPWRVKAAQAKAKLLGKNPRGGSLIIATPITSNQTVATNNIRDFLFALEPLSDWLDRIDARLMG